ncbi:MAG: DUF4115 domain-containing protein [Anaerolineales bacterium]|nr:DUF4115 domain-containing protein [Anaerolineales bacterium]
MSITVGKTLRQARRERKLSLDEAAQATRIRRRYLEAMEAGDFASLPSPLQMRGFLRAYASYLGLEPRPLLQTLESGEPPNSAGTGPNRGTPARAPNQTAEADFTPNLTEQTAAQLKDTPQAHFQALGQQIRAQRELLGLSLEDIERHTHLRRRYLQALESGDIDSLPSPVQGRGMLANYASFLSLDPEPLMLRFAEGLQSQLSERRPEATSREVLPSQIPARRRRQFINRDLLIGGLLAILLLAFGIWGGLRIAEMRSAAQSPPTPPSLAEVLLPSLTPSPAPSPTATQASLLDEPALAPDIPLNPTAAPDPVQIIPSGATGSIQVQIVVEERTYMRALVDDEQVFNGRVLPGSIYLFVGDTRVEITTGSASALRVTFNQQELGTMGNFGQALTRVFTLEGLQIPTPTLVPTASEVPESELTPQP